MCSMAVITEISEIIFYATLSAMQKATGEWGRQIIVDSIRTMGKQPFELSEKHKNVDFYDFPFPLFIGGSRTRNDDLLHHKIHL